MRISLLILLGVLATACEGPAGPTGPEGPPGEIGPAGPGTRISFSGRLNSTGGAWIELPEEAGTLSDPPVIACYVATDPENGWFLAGNGYDGEPGCVLLEEDDGSLAVLFVFGPESGHYLLAVVF